MEEQQQKVCCLREQLAFSRNEIDEMQNLITSLEVENKERQQLEANAEETHKTEIAELNEERNELESKMLELQELISNLRQASMKKAEDRRISEATDNSDELIKLEAEKEDTLKAHTELQKTTKELEAQNILLANETSELSAELSVLESKLALVAEECSEVNEKLDALEEEAHLLNMDCEQLKGKVGNHSSKGSSLFAEVEVGRQHLINEAKKQKEELVALQKTHSQASLEIRKLTKENAKMSKELEYAKEQGSTEELKMQLTTCKQCIKDLEVAQKVRDEEEADIHFVLSKDEETETFYNNLLKEERQKTKGVWERSENIILRYIAATEEVVALKREIAIMESVKLNAEAEIVKLKLELMKGEEDKRKKDVLKLVAERYPFKEMQNVRKSKLAADTVQPSTKKLVTKKEVDKLTRLTSSLHL